MKIGSLLAALVLASAVTVAGSGCVIENVPAYAPAASAEPPAPVAPTTPAVSAAPSAAPAPPEVPATIAKPPALQ